MKSIRRRLTLWLLSGLALLWLAAGAGIYVSVRQGLLKSLDAELAVDARLVRFTARGADADEAAPRGRGQHLQDRLTAYHAADGGSFYQIWSSTGESIERSESLGNNELTLPRDIGTSPVFATAVLSDGRAVRTMSNRVVESGGKGPGKGKGRPGATSSVIVLAKELTGVEQTLASLLGGIVIIGLVAACGAVLLVSVALRHGLLPLRLLGEQTRSIDAPSLHTRFDQAAAPAELQPVYAALNELLQRLEQSFERERRFSADLAHEMRTPVAELKMLSEVALKWPEEADANTHTQALEIANQLESLIDTLLSLAPRAVSTRRRGRAAEPRRRQRHHPATTAPASHPSFYAMMKRHGCRCPFIIASSSIRCARWWSATTSSTATPCRIASAVGTPPISPAAAKPTSKPMKQRARKSRASTATTRSG